MLGSRDKLKARLPARVPDGERVYAVGDIHGRADLLAQLQEQILADAAGRAPARQTVVYLGDYVDRGPQSPVVIDRLIDAPLPGFTSVHLLGNHEDIMLRFHDGDVSVAASWLQYGGRQTLASYGIECDRLPSLAVLRERMAHGVPARHFEFMRGLRLKHRVGDYLFVHAGIRPGVGLERQLRDDLLWIREPFLDSPADHGAVVVHGHSIAIEPQLGPSRIGIDTGAFATGRLTALALEGEERRFLHT